METVEIDGQYRALREEAGACRLDRGFIAVGGTDGAEYLQGQVTNDVEVIQAGSGTYAALLDRKGKMQADMRILRRDDDLLVETEPEALVATLRHLTMYSVGRDVSVADVSGELELIAIWGPAAAELSGLGPLGAEHDHAVDTLAGVEVRVVRTAPGLDLIVDADSCQPALKALAEAGIPSVSGEALEIVRVEAGLPRYGREMTAETIPQEAGINDRAVSFSKGCYIGQETVARLHYRGKPNRHLRGLKLDATVPAGAPVRFGDREVGKVGTAVLSPAHGPIALAILRREAEPGSTVIAGDDVNAIVCEPSFVGADE